MQKSMLPRFQKQRATEAGSDRGGAAVGDRGGNGGGKGGWFIGTPYNVKHRYHVHTDDAAPTGFAGLPPEWEAMLRSSGISRDEVSKHPEEVLDVLCFHFDGPPPKLPRRDDLEREVHEASVITRGDPTQVFSGLHKLGEGASGTVYLAQDKRDNTFVAIKTAPLSDLANLKNEIAIQKLSDHPSIVSVKDTYISSREKKLWIVLEYVHGGTLTGTVPAAAWSFVLSPFLYPTGDAV